MNWYVKRVDSLAKAESEEMICKAMLSAVGDPNAAVYSHVDKERREVVFHFTPSAQFVAEAEGATPCDKPPRHQLVHLVFGDKELLDRLYDEGDTSLR